MYLTILKTFLKIKLIEWSIHTNQKRKSSIFSDRISNIYIYFSLNKDWTSEKYAIHQFFRKSNPR